MEFPFTFIGTCPAMYKLALATNLAAAPNIYLTEIWTVPDVFDGGGSGDLCYIRTVDPAIWPNWWSTDYGITCQTVDIGGGEFVETACEDDMVIRADGMPAEFAGVEEWFQCVDLDFDCPEMFIPCQDGGPCWLYWSYQP